MIEISGTLEGSQELKRRFNSIPLDLDKLSEPLARIGAELMISVDANYGSRGTLFGERWAPRKDHKPHPLLEKTGAMRHNFQQRLGPGYVEISNPTEYFRFHQSNKPRKKLPRRVMLKVDQIRKVFIIKTFQRHMNKAVTGR